MRRLTKSCHALLRLVGSALGLLAARRRRCPAASRSASVATLLVVGQHPRGLLAQALRLVELGADALAALVERVGHGAEAADLPQDRGEDDEGDGDPEFGFEEHRPVLNAPSTRSSAASTAARSGAAAGQPLDDRRRGLGRDAAHARHRLRGAGADRRLGGRDLVGELRLERLALGVGLGGERVARLLRDRLRLRARLGERLLVGGAGGLRLGLQALGLVEVVARCGSSGPRGSAPMRGSATRDISQ